MTPPLLQMRISAGYGKVTVLEQIELELGQGGRLGLVGTSGAGKSTLVLALLGLLPLRRGWVKGEVLVNGTNLLALKERDLRLVRGRQIALVPQSPMSALNGAVSLRVHFQEAWRAHVKGEWDRFEERLKILLDQMHLPQDPAFLLRKPGQVSVGQAQRAVIALALLHRPALLIADEPTSSLDPVTANEILHHLRRINQEDGTGVLFISHDLLSVIQLCETLAVLDQRRIIEHLDIAQITQTAKHPATLALLKTLPAPIDTLRRIQP